VPVTALRHRPHGDYVYVLNDDSTVSQRTVTRGESSNDNVAVMSGLKAGEQVVTEGGDRLKDGARVQTGGRPAGGAGIGARPRARAGTGAFGGARRADVKPACR
jgi:multidrug efflux system membrane fusion protein